MNDVGFLYYRDKDTGEYKILGNVHDLIVKGVIRNCGAMTLTGEPSKIIDTTTREIEEGNKSRGLRANTTVIDDFPFLEEEE